MSGDSPDDTVHDPLHIRRLVEEVLEELGVEPPEDDQAASLDASRMIDHARLWARILIQAGLEGAPSEITVGKAREDAARAALERVILGALLIESDVPKPALEAVDLDFEAWRPLLALLADADRVMNELEGS
ncbi:MAG: hypothetical protein HY875_08010 [Chloroflexi bacterium]|nr:hypothetical protein [Chloroflexota bacterium]